jgi:ketosteroid isomerase-like protein
MSQENVEIVRQPNETFNRGDIEGVLTYYAEDAEFEDLMNAPRNNFGRIAEGPCARTAGVLLNLLPPTVFVPGASLAEKQKSPP